MRTGLIIADFESSFSTTFKHTARVKWGVDFDSSDIQSTLTNLKQLKQNMQQGKPTPCHVGWEITLHDVERVEALLNELLNRWKQQTKVPVHPKLYTFLHQLRELETPTVAQQAKDLVKEIFIPKPSPKLSEAEQKQADIDAIKQQMILKAIRKQNKKP